MAACPDWLLGPESDPFVGFGERCRHLPMREEANDIPLESSTGQGLLRVRT